MDFEDYLKHERNLSRRTIVNWMSTARQFASYLDGKDLSPYSATNRELLEFCKGRAAPGHKDAALRLLSRVRLVMRFLSLQSSPYPTVQKGYSTDAETRITKLLDDGEKKRFIEAFPLDTLGRRDRAFWSIVFFTGLRPSEALKLNLSNLDRDFDSLTWKNAEANTRYVSLDPQSTRFLSEYVSGYRNELGPTDEALFVGRHGGRVGQRNMWLRFHQAKDRAGLEIGIRIIAQLMDGDQTFQRAMDGDESQDG